MRVLRERPLWFRAALPAGDVAKLSQGVTGLQLDIAASSAPVMIGEADVRLVAIAPEVDAQTGLVEALIEVRRSVDELKPGTRANGRILLHEFVEGVVVADSAIVDDAGVAVVYVQIDGETFARREVQVTHRQGNQVLVEGVLQGERVVTVGGAAIRRASLLSTGTVHGHVH